MSWPLHFFVRTVHPSFFPALPSRCPTRVGNSTQNAAAVCAVEGSDVPASALFAMRKRELVWYRTCTSLNGNKANRSREWDRVEEGSYAAGCGATRKKQRRRYPAGITDQNPSRDGFFGNFRSGSGLCDRSGAAL